MSESISGNQAIVLLRELSALHNTGLFCVRLSLHEFFVHLRYDWRLLKRPESGRPAVARLAKWIYLSCRILPLIYVICVTMFSFPGRPDCQVLLKVITATGFIGVVCASSLLSIRVAAVWTWDKRIVGLLSTITTVTLAFAIYFMVEINSSYDPTIQGCALTGVHSDVIPSTAFLVGDCIVLTLLLTGLQRNWHEARQYRVWHVLWAQGLIYLLIAALVEVPVVVLLFMNLNPIMNTMFVTPEVVFLAICATRMYRQLNATVRGGSGNSEIFTNGVSQGVIATTRDNEFQLVTIRKRDIQRERSNA